MTPPRSTRRSAPTRRRADAPPPRVVPRALAVIRDRLRRFDYTEAAVAERLEIPHIFTLRYSELPALRSRLARRGTDPLSALVRLFVFGDALPTPRLERILDPGFVQALVRTRLLRRRSGLATATVALFPVAGAWIATDRRRDPFAREPVMYLGPDSYALAYLTPRTPRASALDLCTGSGVQAVLAARHTERVVGVDIEPRALAFARFNAALNEVADRCRWVLGDLDTALAPGLRFDLLLANPPFVPSPHEGTRALAYRDGGPRGDRVNARLFAAIPARLTASGLALVVTVIPLERDESPEEPLERWLGPRADTGTIWLEQGRERAEDYALAQVRRPFGDSPEALERRYRQWLRPLVRHGITALSGGLAIIKPHRGPSPPWIRSYRAGSAVTPVPEVAPRLVRGHEIAASVIFEDELLERRLRLAADIELTSLSRATETGLEPVGHAVECRGLPLESFAIGLVTALLLESLAPGQSVREACAAIDDEALPPVDELLELLRRGVLE
ncbi:MAG: methyltransferase domain-containing protein, partial [Planctomycetota bacterium]